jgi:hypothetical protein
MNLKSEIKNSQNKAKGVEDTIIYETERWNNMFEETQSQIDNDIKNQLDEHTIKCIRSLMDKVKEIERDITVIQGEIIIDQ